MSRRWHFGYEGKPACRVVVKPGKKLRLTERKEKVTCRHCMKGRAFAPKYIRAKK
jgi:hypothetical protein